MTIDDANTALAIANNKASRLAAYKALALAATRAAAEIEHNPDQSERYALITRLIEARNLLTMAGDYVRDNLIEGDRLLGHRAIDELDQANVHITLAIESL